MLPVVLCNTTASTGDATAEIHTSMLYIFLGCHGIAVRTLLWLDRGSTNILSEKKEKKVGEHIVFGVDLIGICLSVGIGMLLIRISQELGGGLKTNQHGHKIAA